MSDLKLVNIGYGNMVMSNRIVAIVSPESSPIKRLIQEAREKSNLIDATCGRRTRAVLFTDGGYIILSSMQPETLAGRMETKILIDNSSSEVNED